MDKGFSMRKKKSYKGTILIIGLAVLAFVTALNYITTPKIPEETKEVAAVNPPQEIYLEKNAAVNLKIAYNCGHIETETKEADSNIVSKTKEEIEEIHPDWHINEFTSKFISADIPVDSPCENHFFIKLKDDTLYVYRKNNLTESIKEQKINTSMLTKSDITELENGINADTEFEVLEILESFVS